MVKVAVLDNWQRVARKAADWSALAPHLRRMFDQAPVSLVASRVAAARTVFAASIAVLVFGLSAAPVAAGNADAEIDFVTRASISNLFAIAESRLALDHAGKPEIKAFARRLIDDHEAEEAALRPAAEGSGALIPTALDRDHLARMTSLQGKSGTAFDRAYVADQAENHSNALTLYADYMLLGDNVGLKALAIRMIPIAGAQFNSARALSGD